MNCLQKQLQTKPGKEQRDFWQLLACSIQRLDFRRNLTDVSSILQIKEHHRRSCWSRRNKSPLWDEIFPSKFDTPLRHLISQVHSYQDRTAKKKGTSTVLIRTQKRQAFFAQQRWKMLAVKWIQATSNLGFILKVLQSKTKFSAGLHNKLRTLPSSVVTPEKHKFINIYNIYK